MPIIEAQRRLWYTIARTTDTTKPYILTISSDYGISMHLLLTEGEFYQFNHNMGLIGTQRHQSITQQVVNTYQNYEEPE